MAKNLTQKIITAHLASGELVPGQEIALKIDHTLLQDATGTMAMLEFEPATEIIVRLKVLTVACSAQVIFAAIV